MKILCSLGTHTQDFSRLARGIDEVARACPEYDITVQTGVTQYSFQYIQNHFDYCPKDRMQQLMEEADILVLQGGWGGIEEAVDKGKRCVVVPRIEGKEHIHNQEQLVKKLDSLGCVVGCFDIEKLLLCIEKASKMQVRPIQKGDATDVINQALMAWFQ